MKAAREAKNLSRRAFASQIYMSHSNLAEYENGHRLAPADVVERYEQLLQLSPGSLLTLWEQARVELYGEMRDRQRRWVAPISKQAGEQPQTAAGKVELAEEHSVPTLTTETLRPGEARPPGGPGPPEEPPQGLSAAIRECLMRWLLFSVAIALVPILFSAVEAGTRREAVHWSLMLSHGELLLVSAAITAAAAGELLGRDWKKGQSLRLFLVGMSVLIVMWTSLWFAYISSLLRDNKPVDSTFIAIGSVIVFVFAVLTAGCCVVVGVMDRAPESR